jgi:hypothetical protein
LWLSELDQQQLAAPRPQGRIASLFFGRRAARVIDSLGFRLGRKKQVSVERRVDAALLDIYKS